MSSPSFYLGPREPRFSPRSWDDVVVATAAGVLDETHWVELKVAVPPSSKPANLELARDLASLSVDGGVLVIGVEDAAGAAGAVVGTELGGLETRISQVASMRISPPLPVTIDVIRSPRDDDRGVVLVTVPASESAPHMVEERYWGRDARGKRVLSDEEVRRLLGDRQARAVGFTDRVRAAPTRLDPPGLEGRGRMYLVAEPAAAAREPVGDLLGKTHLLQVAVNALQAGKISPVWHPSFHDITYAVPHPDGVAAASRTVDDVGEDSKGFLLVLLTDDGALHVSSPAVVNYGYGTEGPDVVSPGQLLETLHSSVAFAAHVATEHTGFHGAWRIGLLVTGLRGMLPSQVHKESTYRRYQPYQGEVYEATVSTTTQEMTDHTPAVVDRLSRNLLRGLGVQDLFLPYSEAAEISRRGS